LGNSSNRDEWVYDLEPDTEIKKATFLSESYNALLAAGDRRFPRHIKWSADLKARFSQGRQSKFDPELLVRAHWRPFTRVSLYSEKLFSDRLTENHFVAFGDRLDRSNEVLMICGHTQLPFTVHAIDGLPDAGYASRAT